MLTFRLLGGQIRRHPARYVVTSLAIIAAACVIVWVVSGYDSLVAQFDDFAEEYLGRYRYVVAGEAPRTRGAAPPALSESILNELKNDPAVAVADLETHLRAEVKGFDADGKPTILGKMGRFGPPPVPTVVGSLAAAPPYPMVEGRWIDPATDQPEAVIVSQTAERLGIALGQKLFLKFDDRELTVPVVGIVQQVREIDFQGDYGKPTPSRGPATSALYLPMPVAARLLGKEPPIQVAQIVLKDDATPSEFRARWHSRLAGSDPPLALMSLTDIEQDLSQNRMVEGVRNQAYSATGISLLAALFIIFTALSMGVQERIRQFAMLRAVALTRGQIGTLIAVESLLLGVIGWVGGLAAGWGLLHLMEFARPGLFAGGIALGKWCLILSGVGAFGGALIASILPAWKAMRICPVEAMSARTAAPTGSFSQWLTIAGLLLILVNPLLVFVWPMQDESRYGIYLALGCTTMAVGFVLLAPAAIRLTERLLGPILARLLGLDPRLLASELSSNLWRTVGACVALTLGLGLFSATQIWGYSMLQPFVPGDWTPDLLVSFRRGGLPDEEFVSVAAVEGVRGETCLPLAVEQPKLAEDLTDSQEQATATRQDSVIMIGIDPDRGIGFPDALLQFEFVEGDRETAAAKLKQGRYCLVPDHFTKAAGLSVGDSFAVIPPEAPETTVEYVIAGTVKLPGWHWMTKFSGLRRRGPRAAAMVFADFNTVRQDFGLERINFFWMQRDPGVPLETTGKALQEIGDRHPGEQQPTNAQGLWNMGAVNFGETVRLSTPEEVRGFILNRASTVLWGMCQLPLITLAVAGLGVLNTMIASVRARIWSFGVLRSVGLSRFALFRLILAEALLVGLVACVLSLGFGSLSGWCGAGISQYVSFFGGMDATFVLPWDRLGLGFLATLALCLLASFWPAASVARAEPLELLRAGRAAS